MNNSPKRKNAALTDRQLECAKYLLGGKVRNVRPAATFHRA